MYSRITGTGSYLPEKILTNLDLEHMVDTSDEWIRTRTGITQRHIAREDQVASDLAMYACQNAMQAAGVTNKDIDLIIVATTTPDMIFRAPPVFCKTNWVSKTARHLMYRPFAVALSMH